MRGRVVFVRWLMGHRRRIWVGRVEKITAAARAARTSKALWSVDEAARIADEMRRAG